MAKCKNCANLYNLSDENDVIVGKWCPKISDSPDVEAERECVHYKRMTQADRIRSFSDEELAEFLADSEIFSPCKNCDFHFVDAMNDDCKAPDGWICTKGYAAALIQKWLQSEVEE